MSPWLRNKGDLYPGGGLLWGEKDRDDHQKS